MKVPTNLAPEALFRVLCRSGILYKMKPEDLLGQVIQEKYELLRCIAESPAAYVYEARSLLLQSQVAIKLLPPGDRSDEQLERFRREALVTSQLRHPYALKVFDRGELSDGSLWLAMELLSGETLEELLTRERHISQERLKEIFSPVCEVLAEAHQRGIVHRDLHPGNIMLVPIDNDRYLTKILDFGLAGLTAASKLTDPGEISGTPAYMAPEQWLGLSKANELSDIYSLGVLAFRCLSGRLPLDAESPVAWLKAHRREQPIDLWEAMKGRPLSLPVYDAIMHAIARDPNERPSSVKEFWRQLSLEDASQTIADATSSTLPHAPVAPSAPQTTPPAQREPQLWVATLFSALALLVSGVAVGLWISGRPEAPREAIVADSSHASPALTSSSVASPPKSEPVSMQASKPLLKVEQPSPTTKPVKTRVTPVCKGEACPGTTPLPPNPPTEKPEIKPEETKQKPQEIDITEITKNPWKKSTSQPH
jgi:serine/threonine protein kinase